MCSSIFHFLLFKSVFLITSSLTVQSDLNTIKILHDPRLKFRSRLIRLTFSNTESKREYAKFVSEFLCLCLGSMKPIRNQNNYEKKMEHNVQLYAQRKI